LRNIHLSLIFNNEFPINFEDSNSISSPDTACLLRLHDPHHTTCLAKFGGKGFVVVYTGIRDIVLQGLSSAVNLTCGGGSVTIPYAS